MTLPETLTLGLVALCALLYAAALVHGLIAAIQDYRGVRDWWDRSPLVAYSLGILTLTAGLVASTPIMYVLGILVQAFF